MSVSQLVSLSVSRCGEPFAVQCVTTDPIVANSRLTFYFISKQWTVMNKIICAPKHLTLKWLVFHLEQY